MTGRFWSMMKAAAKMATVLEWRMQGPGVSGVFDRMVVEMMMFLLMLSYWHYQRPGERFCRLQLGCRCWPRCCAKPRGGSGFRHCGVPSTLRKISCGL